jgi:hypothetical protein
VAVTITFTGLTPDATYTATEHSAAVSLGTTTADSSGTATVTFTTSASVGYGAHDVQLADSSGNTVISYPFTLIQQALAFTGSPIASLILIALGLLLLGVSITMTMTINLSRRRLFANGRHV